MKRIVIIALQLACCSALYGDDWRAWRGPTGQGFCPEANVPLTWSDKENVKWKIELEEQGNSSPIICGERIFLTQANEGGTIRSLLCLARGDGKLLWKKDVTYGDKERNWNAKWYCNASPATDGERIVACFASAGLFCYDLDGNESPDGLDGRSLQSLLDGRISELHSEIIGYFMDTQQMLRTDRWKYVHYPRIEREQLFDLHNDPHELHDLAHAPEHAASRATLKLRLDNWFKENAAPQTAALQVRQTEARKPESLQAPFDTATARMQQQAWAQYLGVAVDATNSLGARLILIPPGTFMMGSTDEQVDAALKVAAELKSTDGLLSFIRNSERPRHRVVLSKAWRIGATEVTIGQFRRFVEATKYITEAEQYGFGDATKTAADEKIRDSQRPLKWSALRNGVGEDNPVTQVTWNDAQAFCKWLGEQESVTYRLPTEAEWEYACRAGTETLYSFGDDHEQLEHYAWYGLNSERKTHPVGEKRANAFGLYDMHGNVYEWSHDFYNEKWYAASPTLDPRGPDSASHHVIRSGLWPNNASYCRSAARYSRGATARHGFLGFRVVQDL